MDSPKAVIEYELFHSMSIFSRRCRDNIRREGIWVRMKEELIYYGHGLGRMAKGDLSSFILH